MVEVNGQQYQMATCKFTATGSNGKYNFTTLKKIAYNVKSPKKRTNDSEGQTDGFTMDKEDIDSSMSMKLSDWFLFRKWLLDQNPTLGVLQCQFDVSITYGNALNAVKTDALRGVMANEDPRSAEDSQDALMVDVPLFVGHVDFADGNAIVYDR